MYGSQFVHLAYSISIGVFVHITSIRFYAVIMQESQTILADENLTSVVHNDKHMFDRHRQTFDLKTIISNYYHISCQIKGNMTEKMLVHNGKEQQYNMFAVPYVVDSVSSEQELQAILGHVLLL